MRPRPRPDQRSFPLLLLAVAASLAGCGPGTIDPGAQAPARSGPAEGAAATGDTRDPAEPGPHGRRVRELNERLDQLLREPGDHRDELRALLADRAREMAALMDEDPADALRVALSGELRAHLLGMLPDVEAAIERRTRLEGPARMLVPYDTQRGGGAPELWLRTDGELVRVRFAMEVPSDLHGGASVNVMGLRLGRVFVAESGGVGGEALVANACSPLGPQRIAVLLVSYPGVEQTTTPAQLQEIYFGQGGPSLDSFWREASYGKASAEGQVYGPYMLDRIYGCGENSAVEAAALLAADADVDFTQYTRIAVIHPPPPNCADQHDALGELGCSPQSTPGDGAFTSSTQWAHTDSMRLVARGIAVFLAAHEGGHNLGLMHSNAADFGAETLGPNAAGFTNIEYGDVHSTMGRTTAHYPAPQKQYLGWLDPATGVLDVAAPGTYTLPPLEVDSAGPLALRVRRAPNRNEWLWLEYRQPIGFDANLDPAATGGALVHVQTSSSLSAASTMLDFTSKSNVNQYLDAVDAAIPIGSSFFDIYTGLRLSIARGVAGLDVTVAYEQPTCTFVAPTVQVAAHTPASVANGGTATFPVTITNNNPPACPPQVFSVRANISGWPSATAQTITVASGQSGLLNVTRAVSQAVETGSYTVSLLTTSRSATVARTASLSVNSSCVLSAPLVALAGATIAADDQAALPITVTATHAAGCGTVGYQITGMGPPGWQADLGPFAIVLNLDAGAVGTRDITVRVPADAVPGTIGVVTATATSRSPRANGSFPAGVANANITVGAPCVPGAPTFVVAPGLLPVDTGQSAVYTATVTSRDSPSCAPVDFSVYGTVAGWTIASETPPARLGAGQSATYSVRATPPIDLPSGDVTINFTAASRRGQAATTAVARVRAVCVHRPPLVVPVSDLSVQAVAGQSATFDVSITNQDTALCSPSAWTLAALPPAGWTASFAPNPLMVAPGAFAVATATAQLPINASGAPEFRFSAGNGHTTAEGVTHFWVTPICVPQPPTLTIVPPQSLGIVAGWTGFYTLTLRNNDTPGCAPTPADFGQILPPSWTVKWNFPNQFLTYPEHTINLYPIVTVPVTADAGTYPFTVTATIHGSTAQAALTAVVTGVCVRSAPVITLTPNLPSVAAGSPIVYSVSVKNADTKACGGTRAITLTSAVPAGWTSSLAPASLTLAPGATGAATLTKTPPLATVPGNHTVTINAASASGNSSASIPCTVTPPALTTTLTASSVSLNSGSTITLTSKTLHGGAVRANAAIVFTLTRPDAQVVTQSATSDSKGVAVWKYKLPLKGNYSVSTRATYNGQTANSATVTFTGK